MKTRFFYILYFEFIRIYFKTILKTHLFLYFFLINTAYYKF